jgi:hypothetical protein
MKWFTRHRSVQRLVCLSIILHKCRKGQKVFLEAGSFVYYTIAMILVGLG